MDLTWTQHGPRTDSRATNIGHIKNCFGSNWNQKRETAQFEINLEDRLKIETIKEKTKTIIKKNQVIQVRICIFCCHKLSIFYMDVSAYSRVRRTLTSRLFFNKRLQNKTWLKQNKNWQQRVKERISYNLLFINYDSYHLSEPEVRPEIGRILTGSHKWFAIR